MDSKLSNLEPQTRKTLLKLACFAAWSDLSVAPEERREILSLAVRMAVDAEEMAEIESWLKGPPGEVDPYELPVEHRQLFLDTLCDIVEADGVIAPEECETVRLIREFIG